MNVKDVATKVDVVTDNVANLRLLPTTSHEEFAGDFRNTNSALHLLQTSIQALIDIASYVVSNLGLRSPANSADVVNVLQEQGLITEERAATCVKMVQFRNRVVHLYNRIDTQMLYSIVTNELGDISELLVKLLDVIEANPD